jgi:uncharacterized protein (TIGR02453 family)
MTSSFSNETIPFLTEAGQKTDPHWLDAHADRYEKFVKKPFIDLAAGLKAELQPLLPDYHFPTQGIGRIKKTANKIVDGMPCYKDWLSISASVPPASRFERNPHLFFGILPNIQPYMGVVVAGGLFMPSSPQLKKMRMAIADDASAFHALFADAAFKKRFKANFSRDQVAARAPRGYDASHPDVDWLMLKSFLVRKNISAEQFTSPALLESVVEDFKQLARLNRLMESVLD